ncbi:MAG: hypothetical protein NZ551_10270 [Microscillaceae bacterium]|nr:hypothetical protein [Microscillaceae bacterium]MDW8461582.1 hypothetical protein [Cytophagales bacterium]
MSNKSAISLALFFLVSINAYAQSVNEKVLKCLEDTKFENLDNFNEQRMNFQFAAWAKKLHLECDRMISRMSSEKVEAIAQEREAVIAMAKLSESCDVLKAVQNPLQKIEKIYKEKIKEKTTKPSANMLTVEDNKAYLMTLDDAKELKKQLETIIKKLKL